MKVSLIIAYGPLVAAMAGMGVLLLNEAAAAERPDDEGPGDEQAETPVFSDTVPILVRRQP